MHRERLRLLLFLLLGARLAYPMELQIQFSALERLLAEQVFTQEGRRYVRGGKSDKCNFAYLEKPRVELHNFRVTDAHVANDALILVIDFELTVK